MTGQIADRYYYNGEEYSFVAYQPKLNFTPQVFNLTPSSISTSCWRGFWCSFDISDSGLYLNELYIHTDNDKYPDILNVKVADIEYVECMATRNDNGKKVTSPFKYEKYRGHRQYKSLMYPIFYSGSLVLGKGFLRNYYIHCGFQRFYTYKTLIELEFKNGKVINCIDRSAMAAFVRDKIDANGVDMSDFPDIGSMIKQVKEEKSLENIWWLK